MTSHCDRILISSSAGPAPHPHEDSVDNAEWTLPAFAGHFQSEPRVLHLVCRFLGNLLDVRPGGRDGTAPGSGSLATPVGRSG